MKEKTVVLEWTSIESGSSALGEFIFTDRKEVRK